MYEHCRSYLRRDPSTVEVSNHFPFSYCKNILRAPNKMRLPISSRVISENTFRGHLKSIFASTTANCFLSGPKGWETRSLMSWRVLDNRLALHFSLFSPMVCVALISISRRASIELKTIGGVNARISLVELGCRLRARTYFGIEWQPLRT